MPVRLGAVRRGRLARRPGLTSSPIRTPNRLAERHPMVSLRAVAFLALASALALGDAEAQPLENCLKGEAAYRAGDHDLEVEFYTRCIDEDGPRGARRAIAHNNRGVAHLARGDADSAIADYDSAIAIDPDYAVAYANRGLARLAKGEFVHALQDYDTAIRLDPAYGPAYASRCWLFAYMGYGETALADCDASLDLRPDDPATLDTRAFAYWILEDRERARRDVELARRLDPARPTWQERFVEFENEFSVGYPYSTASVQSADSHRPEVDPQAPQEPAVLLADPH